MKRINPKPSIFTAPEPPANLVRKIIARIERRERYLFRAKLAGFTACVMGSLAVTDFGFMNAATELSHSGFFSFTSLLFSDFSSAIANFPDFFLSIMESIPAIPISLFLGGIVFLLWSIAAFSKEITTRANNHQFSLSQ